MSWRGGRAGAVGWAQSAGGWTVGGQRRLGWRSACGQVVGGRDGAARGPATSLHPAPRLPAQSRRAHLAQAHPALVAQQHLAALRRLAQLARHLGRAGGGRGAGRMVGWRASGTGW